MEETSGEGKTLSRGLVERDRLAVCWKKLGMGTEDDPDRSFIRAVKKRDRIAREDTRVDRFPVRPGRP